MKNDCNANMKYLQMMQTLSDINVVVPFNISFSALPPVQFLMYVDSVGSGSPMDMETDGPLLDDVNMLKKAVAEEATQVRDSAAVNTQTC